MKTFYHDVNGQWRTVVQVPENNHEIFCKIRKSAILKPVGANIFQGSQSSGFSGISGILNFKSAPTDIIPKMHFFKKVPTPPEHHLLEFVYIRYMTFLFYSHVFLQIASLISLPIHC